MQLGFTRWLGLAAVALAAGGVAQAKSKSYAAGHFSLTLDGQSALVKSIDGGGVKAETAAAAVIEIDRVGADALWTWLAGDWGQTKKTLVLPLAKKRRMDWTEGYVQEVKFPKLSASEGKKEVSLTLTIAGQSSTPKKGDGADLKGVVNAKQKKWLSSNFRLRIGDLPTARVSKIDSFTIKQGTVQDEVKVTLDAADATAWKVAVKAKSKKAGAIELTDDDGTVWKTVDLGAIVVSSLKANVASLKVGSVSLH